MVERICSKTTPGRRRRQPNQALCLLGLAVPCSQALLLQLLRLRWGAAIGKTVFPLPRLKV